MNSKICHDTLGIPEYFQKHQHRLLSNVEPTIFYIAKVRFSRILRNPFLYKSHFFDQRKDEFENLSHDKLTAVSIYSGYGQAIHVMQRLDYSFFLILCIFFSLQFFYIFYSFCLIFCSFSFFYPFFLIFFN